MSNINIGFQHPEDIGPVMADIRTHADILFSQQPDIFDKVAGLMGAGIAGGIAEQVIDFWDVRRLYSVYKHGANCLRMREGRWSATDRRNDLHFRLGISATSAGLRLAGDQIEGIDAPRHEPRYFRFLQ